MLVQTLFSNTVLFVRLKLGGGFILGTLILTAGCSPSSDKSVAQNDGPPESEPVTDFTRSSSVEQVENLLARGQIQEASSLNRRLLIESPRSSALIRQSAMIAAAQGKYETAVQILDARPNDFSDTESAVQVATWLIRASQYDRAEKHLKLALKANQQAHSIRHLLASLLNRMGRRHEASDHLRYLCQLGDINEWELRSLLSVSESYERWLEVGPTRPSNLAMIGSVNQARMLRLANRPREALELTETIVLQGGVAPEVAAFHGRQLFELQEVERANAWLDAVDPKAKRFSDYWVAIGIEADWRGQYAESLRCFAEAIQRDPTDYEAYHFYTKSLGKNSEPEIARMVQGIQQVVLETGQLGTSIGQATAQDEREVGRLAGYLTKLERPFEALKWMEFAAQRHRLGSDVLRTIATRRVDLWSRQADPGMVALGGLKLSQYKLPDRKLRDAPTSLAASSSLLLPAAIPPRFEDVSEPLGIEHAFFNGVQAKAKFLMIYQQFSAGIACHDFDRDGRCDLYLGQGASDSPGLSGVVRGVLRGVVRGVLPNQMLRQTDARFINTTDQSLTDDRGYATGVTTGDWNQDGFPDLVVGNLGVNRLFINQGDGTFRAQRGDAVWNQGTFTSSLAIADMNGDALPDLVEVNYLDDDSIFKPVELNAEGHAKSIPGPLKYVAGQDRIFLNEGQGNKMSGNALAGENAIAATGLGVAVTDWNGDGKNECLIANDMMANHFWHVDQNEDTAEGNLIDRAPVHGCAYDRLGQPNACMGIAVADFNEDQRLDMHITNLDGESVNLFQQRNDGGFADVSALCGLSEPSFPMLGFGTQPLDYDNNTSVDLVVGNGQLEDWRYLGKDYRMPIQLFQGHRSKFVLTTIEDPSGYCDRGHLSRAVATLDWNRDGRTDVIVADLIEPVALLQNQTPTAYHWFQVSLIGTSSERDAIGARVIVTLNEGSGDQRQLIQTITAGDGYMCKNEPILTFGLGTLDEVEQLAVHWPSGETQRFRNVAADQRWIVIEGETDVWRESNAP